MGARFKELCLDTYVGPDRPAREDLARFWAAVTGCEYQPDPEGAPGGVVPPAGGTEGMGIAICPVPEPRTVKQRVHLDVHAGSLADVLDLGARVLTPAHEGQPWTVCADPEGNEFCVFERDPDFLAALSSPYRTYEMGVDAADPERIAGWWGEAFGLEPQNEGEPWWWLDGVPGCPFTWVFAPVPEPKTVKNRMHWDVYGEVGDFVRRGAARLWEVPGRTRPIAWTVLGDPEGNEFCVFPER